MVSKKELALRNLDDNDPEYEYYLNLQPTETVDHLFWDCPHTREVIQRAYRWVIGGDWYRGREVIDKIEFMIGQIRSCKRNTVCDLVWKLYVKYFIYRCRKQNKLPRFGNLINELMNLATNTKKYKWDLYTIEVQGG